MRNRYCFILVLLGLVLLSPSIIIDTDATDTVTDIDWDVAPMDHAANGFHIDNVPSMECYYGEITVTDEDVRFYVVDTSGYAEVQLLGSTTEVLYDWGIILGTLSFEFVADEAESYYFVFANYDTLFNTANVEGWISHDRTEPSVTVGLSADSVEVDEEFTISIDASDNFELAGYEVYYHLLGEDSHVVTYTHISGTTFSRTIQTSRSISGDFTLNVIVTDLAGFSRWTSVPLTVNEMIPGPFSPEGSPTTLLIVGAIGIVSVAAVAVVFIRKR